MKEPTEVVLSFLAEIGFETRSGPVSPFGEELPLVRGSAWDSKTAQFALIAEMTDSAELDSWRQLLFASSGLRHHLVGDRASAFGTPVVLAIVDGEGERALRDLADDLADRYVLFNRVDLNLVRRETIEDRSLLADGLAPLLPRCRSALNQGLTISGEEVRSFWRLLREEIHSAADRLDPGFGAHRTLAANYAAEFLVGDLENQAELPGLAPVRQLKLTNFRSFAELSLTLEQVTVIHGPNGGGKSSILEALEIGWTGTSQRKPHAVKPEEYERHLPRGGDGGFAVSIDDDAPRTSIDANASAESGRAILTQDAVASLVNQGPEERYSELLAATGLALPSLDLRTDELVLEAKGAADRALNRVGLPQLPKRNSDGLKHLRRYLSPELSRGLPDATELRGVANVASHAVPELGDVQWPPEDDVAAALIETERLVRDLIGGDETRDETEATFELASVGVARLIERRVSARRHVQAVVHAAEARTRARPLPPKTAGPTDKVDSGAEAAPLTSALATRWLTHATTNAMAASQFLVDASTIEDSQWQAKLRAYAEALMAVAELAPQAELRLLSRPVADSRNRAYPSQSVPRPSAVAPELLAYADALDRQIAELDRLLAHLRDHPARRFLEQRDHVLGAICGFELARHIKLAKPINVASERMISRLLAGRLAPTVRELVAAIVRFEWYFQPLLVPDEGQRIVLGGLATSRADLDARLLLNSAERSALGLAWFLSLHLLQPESRRQVLVLDDPSASFDLTNRAGFLSTLRAFVRLVRPAQLVLSTHDAATAALFAEEMAPLEGWPSEVGTIKVWRDGNDASVTTKEETHGVGSRSTIDGERLKLGLAPLDT